MPKVTVRVFATFRDLLGWKTLDMDADVEDVEELIMLVADRFQPSFKDVLIDPKNGEIRKGFSILVNGQDIKFLNGLGTKLKNSDIVAIFPPVAGG